MSATTRASEQRKETSRRKGKAKGPATRINWRDPEVWLALILVLAVGFGAAWAVWLNTWRDDLAAEHNFYVSSSVAALRAMRTQLDSSASAILTSSSLQGATPAIVGLATSAAKLQATLTQIPRRGPVQWKAEMIGLASTLQARVNGILEQQLAAPSSGLLTQVGVAIPALRTALEDLDAALTATVDSSGSQAAPRLNLTAEVLTKLEAAIAAARAAASALPE